jgi:hypothetical protein
VLELTFMSALHPETRWSHALARCLSLKPAEVYRFIKAGKLPGMSVRDESERLCYDGPALAAIERARSQFDTPAEPFVDDLLKLTVTLRSWRNEDSAPNRRLVEFRFGAFGEHGEPAYPIDRQARPWRGHRVPVTREELIAAGYARLHESFHAPYCKEGPFCQVRHGGEAPLMTMWAYHRPKLQDRSCVHRAEFLAALAGVIVRRAPLNDCSDLLGAP